MSGEIIAAFQSAKTLFELIKVTKELSNSTDVLTAVNDVQMKLSSAIASALASQEKQAALAERVRELEAQLRDVENWENLIQRYEHAEFPTKALAYKLKSEMANDGEPIHYLCNACVDKKKKTTLQPMQRRLYCPECKSTITIQALAPPPMNHRK